MDVLVELESNNAQGCRLSLRAFEISEAEVHSTLIHGVGHCWWVTSRVDALVL
jgi:hypothetical protein